MQKLVNKITEIDLKIHQSQENLQELTNQQIKMSNEQIEIKTEIELLNQEIAQYQDLFQELAQKLASIKQVRDETRKAIKKN